MPLVLYTQALTSHYSYSIKWDNWKLWNFFQLTIPHLSVCVKKRQPGLWMWVSVVICKIWWGKLNLDFEAWSSDSSGKSVKYPRDCEWAKWVCDGC